MSEYLKMSHAALVEELERRDRNENRTFTEKTVRANKIAEALKEQVPLPVKEEQAQAPILNPTPNVPPPIQPPAQESIKQVKIDSGSSQKSAPQESIKNPPYVPAEFKFKGD